ncbi:MAG: hypothetical protein K940chlam9_01571 [Chlamydiae bacterium]|nr:hypothetical protein [Chlamydiota bacterium]
MFTLSKGHFENMNEVGEAYYDRKVHLSIQNQENPRVFEEVEVEFTELEAKDAQNLVTLFNRAKGEKFRVGNDKTLQKVRGLRGRISHWWNRKEEEAKVRSVVESALTAYNGFLARANDEKVHRTAAYLFNRQGTAGIGRFGERLISRKFLLKQTHILQHLAPIGLGEENAQANYNLYRLANREKGEAFEVDKHGTLKKVSGLCGRISYCAHRSERQEAVQTKVRDTLFGLNGVLGTIEAQQIHKVVLGSLFAPESPLVRMSPKVFYRGAIEEGSALEGELEELFYLPQLRGKRKNLTVWLKRYANSDKTAQDREALEKAFSDYVYAEFLFTQRLGIDLERVGDGGSGGARYARNRHHAKILVIKPGDEGPHGVNNPQWYARVKQFFVKPHPCLNGNSEPQSEVDSYSFDRKFQFHIVPPTQLRRVGSPQFNGQRTKECSVQMFVEGCETLADYTGITSWKYNMFPRPLLRWLCRRNREELEKNLPQQALERVGAHNFLIEDIDCHFENILVKVQENLDGRFDLATLQERQVDEFMDHFFFNGNHQRLLDSLFYSEVNANRQLVTLIKHDGGSSNPRSHPSGPLALRFKHLFEVLPHFEHPFSDATKELIMENGVEHLEEALLAKAERQVRNMPKDDVSRRFWEDQTHREIHFPGWVLSHTNSQVPEFEKRIPMIQSFIQVSRPSNNPTLYRETFYFTEHFKRIHGNLKTRVHSYQILNGHMRQEKSMRELFSKVRSAGAFKRELHERA